MAVIFANRSASLDLRQIGTGFPWSGKPGITQLGRPLSYNEMDTNWWNLYDWSLQLDDLSRGAAYTGSNNTFLGTQTFTNLTSTGTTNLGITSIGGQLNVFAPATFNNGLNVAGGVISGNGAGIHNFVTTSSYIINSGSFRTAFYSASIDTTTNAVTYTSLDGTSVTLTPSFGDYATKAGVSASINDSSSALTADLNNSSSTLQTNIDAVSSSFVNWKDSNNSVFAGTASYLNISGSNIGVSWNGAVVTLTGHSTASFVTTSSLNAFTASVKREYKTTASFNAWTGSSSSTFNGTSRLAATASYIDLVAGPGISINRDANNLLEITASVRTVNGIGATNGNVPISLARTYTGDSASLSTALPTGLATGSLWIISGDPTTSNNGRAFLMTSASGTPTWSELASFDYATADARYLKLDASNDPMQGALDMGGFRINGLANGVASTDAINLGQLTASAASLRTGVTASIVAFSASNAVWTKAILNASSSTLQSNLNTTASILQATASNAYVSSSITGNVITFVQGNGDTDHTITVPQVDISGLATTASLNDFTASVQREYTTTASFHTYTGSVDTHIATINNWTGSVKTTASFNQYTGSLNTAITASINTATGSAVVSSTISNNVITFTKGDGTTYTNTILSASNATNAVNATTASYVKVVGDNITVKYSVNGIELTGSAGGSTPNLQSVTTVGNVTSASISSSAAIGFIGTASWAQSASVAISSSYALSSSYAVTSSYAAKTSNADLAVTASYVKVLGDNITVKYSTNGIELTGSNVNGFATTSSLNDFTASFNVWSGSVTTTASFHSFTASYNTGSFTGSFTGSLLGTALTASYIDITGSGISINYFGPQIQLTASRAQTSSYSLTSVTASIVEVFATTDTSSLYDVWYDFSDKKLYYYVPVPNFGTGFNAAVYAGVQRSDFTTVFVGDFTTYNGSTQNKIVGIDKNGTVTTAEPNTGTGGSTRSSYVTIDENDNITWGGGSTATQTYNGGTYAAPMKINAQGVIDATWIANIGSGKGSSPLYTGIYDRNTQKYFYGGNAGLWNGSPHSGLIALNNDGTLNSSFMTNIGTGPTIPLVGFTPPDVAITKVYIDSSGKIWVGGNFSVWDGSPSVAMVVLNADGTVHHRFTGAWSGAGISGGANLIYSMQELSSGKMVIVGDFRRLFGVGVNPYDAGGTPGTSNAGVLILNPDYTVDATAMTNLGTGFTGTLVVNLVYSVIELSNGKVAIGGGFTTVNGLSRSGIVVLDTDATVDTSFNPGTGFTGGRPLQLVETPGGIRAVGAFSTYNGTIGLGNIAEISLTGQLLG